MSTKLYIQMLKRADEALQQLLPEDQDLLAKTKPIKDVEGARLTVARLYLIYGQIVKELDMCYFQMVHPQKRDLVRKLLDLSVGRMLELKAELVTFDNADTVYLDDVLIALHMTPYNEKSGALMYYARDRDKELQARLVAMDATEAKIETLAETRAAIDELGVKIEELAETCLSLDMIDEDAMAGVAAKAELLNTIAQMLDALEQGKGSKEAVDRKLQDVGTWRIMLPQYEGTAEEVAARNAAADYIHRQLEELTAKRDAVKSIDRQQDALPARRAAMEEVDARLQKLAAWRKALQDFDRQLAELTFKRAAFDDPNKKRGALPPGDDVQPTRTRRFKKAQVDEEEEEAGPAEEGGPTREQEVAAAVALIQRHERARQGRTQYAEAARLSRLKKRAAAGELPPRIPAKVLNGAATQIQRVWRGYSTRKKLKRQEERRRMVMSEVVPSWRTYAELERVSQVYEHRRGVLEAHFREMEDFIAADLERYERKRWPWLLEQYCDELRAWFQEWYEKCKCFPFFPDEEDGGSMLLVLGQLMTPEQYLEVQELKRLEALKSPKEKEKERKEKEKQKQKEKEARKKEKEKEKAAKERLKKLIAMGKGPVGFKPKPSKVMPQMELANEEFGSVWRCRDDTANTLQRLEEDMARDENRPIVEARIRQAADVMMRVELEQLEAALLRDNKGKGKKKPPKKKKKKKGGKKKDPTKNRTTESLFEELYAEGVIRRYEPARLSDFFGEISLNAFDYRLDGRNPPGAPGDVRHLIRDLCMLPMGSETVHRLAPLVRSVCILGPPQSGKKLLARAVCTELGAVMFDLTPKNLAGKYPGNKGLKMLLHLIEKMSRVLQPTVLFVDGAEKMFYKRVPPEEKNTEPKKLATKLPKIVKKIKGEDRVLLLGTSSQPWAAGPKLSKAYEKFVLLPRNDYGTVRAIWHSELMAYHGVSREIDLSGLTQMTVGYTLPAIRSAVQQTLTVERRLRLAQEPLHPLELYRPLE
ncbi:IQ and AAA domain-containing protein 1-like, partial [Schistocerca gregaria]|uniref:IQ and AAA domain-containing protein 1-like n=1 Tax=Schistocerca gregaria TaxID=7010 RepID=UPI00211E367F